MTESFDPPGGPWLTVPALSDATRGGAKRPSFTPAALRALLAQRHQNGLGRYVRKLGSKVVVSLPGFWQWIAEQADPQDFSDDGEQPPEEGPDVPRPERRPFRREGVR